MSSSAKRSLSGWFPCRHGGGGGGSASATSSTSSAAVGKLVLPSVEQLVNGYAPNSASDRRAHHKTHSESSLCARGLSDTSKMSSSGSSLEPDDSPAPDDDTFCTGGSPKQTGNGRRQRRQYRRMTLFSSPFSRDAQVFTDAKKRLIVLSWRLLLASHNDNLNSVGCAIFQGVFTAAPELRNVFNVPPDVSDEQLTAHQPVTRVCNLVAMVFNLCVRNVFSLEAEMSPVLIMYGQRHAQMTGFTPHYLAVFNQALESLIHHECVNNDEFDDSIDDCVNGWRLLLTFVTSKMIEGMHASQRAVSQMGGRGRRKSLFSSTS